MHLGAWLNRSNMWKKCPLQEGTLFLGVKNPLAMRVVQESQWLCREKPPMLS